jgi:hypothetical protein
LVRQDRVNAALDGHKVQPGHPQGQQDEHCLALDLVRLVRLQFTEDLQVAAFVVVSQHRSHSQAFVRAFGFLRVKPELQDDIALACAFLDRLHPVHFQHLQSLRFEDHLPSV